MLRAAFRSALSSKPQETHLKVAWVFRLDLLRCPHLEHVLLVFLGSTNATGTPRSAAL